MTRSGIGWDSHRLAAGRKLILGGVEIDHDRGLDGHSDADVLAHAVIDALLGAAALGDIGQHFPDTDERYRNADSIVLLTAALDKIKQHGFVVIHVDCTVMMEKPKIKDYRDAISASMAGALGVDADCFNLKATTGEGIGFVGRQEGVAAMAIATILRAP